MKEDNTENSRVKALELIRDWDKTRGEYWSNDSEAIADIMVEFLSLQNEEILDIIYRSTKNRSSYKLWERKIIAKLKGNK
jgi:hypothetical protein